MVFHTALSTPFNVLWRAALVKLPRAVPKEVLHWTCPQGPHPIVVELPSKRGKHKIPVYVFVPRSITPTRQDPVPVVVDFHGGGFFLGSCLEQAPFCTYLANELDAVVISVDYRMAPVDQFPAAQWDADEVMNTVLKPESPGYDILREGVRSKILSRWSHANKTSSSLSFSSKDMKPPSVSQIDLDATKVAITGFSSGGNLAMNLAIDAPKTETEEAWPSPFTQEYSHPFAVALYYAAIDLRQLPSERTKPPKLPASKGFWAELNDLLAPSYLPRERATEYRASPGLAPIETSLHKQARLQFVLAEVDDLTGQNDEWISKASRAGRSNDVVVHRYQDQTHGWTQMPESWLNESQRSTREDAFNKTVNFIRSTWEEEDLAPLRMQATANYLTVEPLPTDRKGRKSPRPWKKSSRNSLRSSRTPSPVKEVFCPKAKEEDSG